MWSGDNEPSTSPSPSPFVSSSVESSLVGIAKPFSPDRKEPPLGTPHSSITFSEVSSRDLSSRTSPDTASQRPSSRHRPPGDESSPSSNAYTNASASARASFTNLSLARRHSWFEPLAALSNRSDTPIQPGLHVPNQAPNPVLVPAAREGVARPPPEVSRAYRLKKQLSPANFLPAEELKGKNGDRFKLKCKLEKPDKEFLMEMMNRGEMFVVSDAGRKHNRIDFASPAFIAYTRYTREELIGRDLRFLQGNETEPEDAGDIRDAIQLKYDSHFGICNYRADGTPFFNQFFMTPLRKHVTLGKPGHGPVAYFIAVQVATTPSTEKITRENVRKYSSLFRYRQSAELGTNLHSASILDTVMEETGTAAPTARPHGLERAIGHPGP